ncbi:helix-turn-helix domain-containing protein [Listeria innocua]|uniref:helix-turn-helix domain-containing protein n=1 Tax=Listeria innocua TaxID=1642 RepID=UPI0035E3D0CF
MSRYFYFFKIKVVKNVQIKEACKKIGVPQTTIYRWRKKMGILEETRDGLTDEHLEMFQKMKKTRAGYHPTKNKKEKVVENAVRCAPNANELKVNDGDIREVRALKEQYNSNLKVIDFANDLIFQSMDRRRIPDKYLTDLIDKYQSLNVKLLRSLGKLAPLGSDDSTELMEKLSDYI